MLWRWPISALGCSGSRSCECSASPALSFPGTRQLLLDRSATPAHTRRCPATLALALSKTQPIWPIWQSVCPRLRCVSARPFRCSDAPVLVCSCARPLRCPTTSALGPLQSSGAPMLGRFSTWPIRRLAALALGCSDGRRYIAPMLERLCARPLRFTIPSVLGCFSAWFLRARLVWCSAAPTLDIHALAALALALRNSVAPALGLSKTRALRHSGSHSSVLAR